MASRRVTELTQIDRWTMRLLSGAILFSQLALSSCAQLMGEPDWVTHATAAHEAFKIGNFAEADKQAKLVLAAADRYGGKVPPSAPSPSFELFPDPAKDYTGSLIELGESYERFKKWNDAEQFYREALKLETIKFGPSSPASTIGMPALIDLLKKTGRTKEAIELQTKLVSIENADAAHDGGTLVRRHALQEQAKLSSLKGNADGEEGAWKKRVDLYKSELLDKQKLAETKQANTEAWKHRGGVRTLNIIQSLEDLARYYHQRKEYAKEEDALVQAQSARQTVLPDALLGQGWDDLARVYALEHKDTDEAKALEQAIRCLEIDKLPQQSYSIAFAYERYSQVLQKLGRPAEARQAKESAHKIEPSAF